MPDDDEQKEIGKLLAEVHPTHEEHLKSFPPVAAPPEGEARQIHELYGELFPLKKELKDVTPDQQASVDKALAKTTVSQDIGGASAVSSKPVPNDPAPIETVKTLGQNLHKAGVTMDK